MGLMDKIRELFSDSKNTQKVQKQEHSWDEKIQLAKGVYDLYGQIQRINCFDISVCDMMNVSYYDFTRKDYDELEKLNERLGKRLSELKPKPKQNSTESRRTAEKLEELEAAKWTGNKPAHMSDADFDRWQRSDDR